MGGYRSVVLLENRKCTDVALIGQHLSIADMLDSGKAHHESHRS